MLCKNGSPLSPLRVLLAAIYTIPTVLLLFPVRNFVTYLYVFMSRELLVDLRIVFAALSLESRVSCCYAKRTV
jgi:hypothetical protein